MVTRMWFWLRKGILLRKMNAGSFRKAKRRMKCKLNGYKKLEREIFTL